MSSLALYWSRTGELQELDGYPESVEHWVAGEPLDETYHTIVRAVESAISQRIAEMDVRLTSDSNIVLDVLYENGAHDIVRTANPSSEQPTEPHAFRREIALMKWLKAARPTIPIPALRCVIEPQQSVQCPVVVMEKLPGEMVMNAIGRAPYTAKKRLVTAMADFQVELFRLDVPQRIGPADFTGGQEPAVPPDSALTVYLNLDEYVSCKINEAESSLQDKDEATRTRRAQILGHRKAILPDLYARLARPSLRRCVLKHEDLHATNVLMDAEGNLTGVIDWECQSILPAALSVDYPPWIQYEGIRDPKHDLSSEHGGVTWWMVSREDAARLRETYAETIKNKDRECWEALVEGRFLRQILECLAGDAFGVLQELVNDIHLCHDSN